MACHNDFYVVLMCIEALLYTKVYIRNTNCSYKYPYKQLKQAAQKLVVVIVSKLYKIQVCLYIRDCAYAVPIHIQSVHNNVTLQLHNDDDTDDGGKMKQVGIIVDNAQHNKSRIVHLLRTHIIYSLYIKLYTTIIMPLYKFLSTCQHKSK